MDTAHEEEMYRIVSRFVAACAAPTKRFRRMLCGVCLAGAVLLGAVGMRLVGRLEEPLVLLALLGFAFVLLAVALRLALNDMRDVREQYRRSRRDLFVRTFSDEEFKRKVREKREKLGNAEANKE